MGIIITILIGALAGFLAGKIMKGADFGNGDTFVGIVGGFIGGNVLSWLGIHWAGLIGQIITAVIGAVILLWIISLKKKSWVGDFSKKVENSLKIRTLRVDIERTDNCCDGEMKDAVSPLVVFLCGLLSMGFIVYIVINYFSSFVLRLGVAFGDDIAILKLFPHYLRGYYITHGPWFQMISAVVLGFLANLLNFMTGEKNNKLTKVGQWLGDASITIGLIFIIMAFTA